MGMHVKVKLKDGSEKIIRKTLARSLGDKVKIVEEIKTRRELEQEAYEKMINRKPRAKKPEKEVKPPSNKVDKEATSKVNK